MQSKLLPSHPALGSDSDSDSGWSDGGGSDVGVGTAGRQGAPGRGLVQVSGRRQGHPCFLESGQASQVVMHVMRGVGLASRTVQGDSSESRGTGSRDDACLDAQVTLITVATTSGCVAKQGCLV